MSIEYLGQVTNLVTCEELIELTNFAGGSSDSTGNITWGKILENGKIYLVSQALPKRNISFSALNSQGLIFGKTIAIGKDKYICRSMTGLNDDNSYGGEWSRWVIDLLIPQGMNFSNLAGRYRFTQDILNEKAVLVGYYNNSSTYTTLAIDSSSTNYSWSPVLELLPRCEFSINSEDLGNTFNPVCIKYVVLGDTHTLIEKINGTQIRTLDNQVSGTEHTLDLSQQWDNINYGSHTIEIIATDSNGLSSTVEITFNKIKEITKPIPITSSLKEFVNHIDNVGKDVDYLRYNLKNNLIKKGVECSDTDKISNLIDKVGSISLGRKWANGKYDSEYTNKTSQIIMNLDFVPSMIFVIPEKIYLYGYTQHAKNFVISNLNTSPSDTLFVTGNGDFYGYISDVNQNSFTLSVRGSVGAKPYGFSSFVWYAFE